MTQRRLKRFIRVSTFMLLFFCVKFVILFSMFLSRNALENDRQGATLSVESEPCTDNTLNKGSRDFICPFKIPCLHTLTPGTTHDRSVESNRDRNELLIIQEIHRIPGSLDPVHYHLAPIIASIQWNNGIYGAVGEFGVGFGKFTSLLAQNTNTDVGERLFVVDSFSQAPGGQPGDRLTQYDIFSANLRRLGFYEKGDGSRLMHIHRGTTEDFPLERLKEWQLPLFRLISVNAQLINASLLPVLELAACLLTDGGILVVGGVEDGVTQGMFSSAVENLFTKDGGMSGMNPILVAGDKLFLATSNWSELFLSQVKDTAERLHLRLAEDGYIFGIKKDVLRIIY